MSKKIGIISSVLVLMMIVIFALPVFADNDITELTFYSMSSAATTHLTNAMIPDVSATVEAPQQPTQAPTGATGATETPTTAPVTPTAKVYDTSLVTDSNAFLAGNVGMYLGYIDKDKTADIPFIGNIISSLSNSSSTFTYDTFRNLSVGDKSNYNGFYYYLQYGNLLAQLGLDSTGSGGMSINGVIRFVAGGLMLFVYLMSTSVPWIFGIVLDVLKAFNPFRLFSGVTLVAKFMHTGTGTNSIFENVFSEIARLYNALSDLSWAVLVPFFFLTLVITVLLVNKTGEGNATKYTKIKKYLIRIVFIVLGVPICAALYTSCLDSMSDFVSQKTTPATKIIASTFVDFEKWVETTQLAPPAGGVLSCADQTVGDSAKAVTVMKVNNTSYSNLRKTCFSINSEVCPIPSLHNAYLSDIKSTLSYNIGNLTSSDESGGTAGDTVALSQNDMVATMEFLARYMTSDMYYASNWESYIAQKQMNSFTDKEGYTKWLSNMTKAENWVESNLTGDDNKAYANAMCWNGGLKYNVFGTHGSGDESYGLTDSSGKGLSTLAMYNYLNTKFNPTSAEVYSSEKSASAFVRSAHYSVNLIGGDAIMGLLFYTNSVTLILAYAVIGWFYAIAMMFGNLKRSIRAITSIPFALLGAIPAIIKTIAYVCILIIEIIATFFLYMLVSELLFSVNNMIEGFTNTIVGNLSVVTIQNGGLPTDTDFVISGLMLPVTLLVQIVATGIFTFQAIKLRKPIINTISEKIEEIVNNLISSPVRGYGSVGGGPRGANINKSASKGGNNINVGRNGTSKTNTVGSDGRNVNVGNDIPKDVTTMPNTSADTPSNIGGTTDSIMNDMPTNISNTSDNVMTNGVMTTDGVGGMTDGISDMAGGVSSGAAGMVSDVVFADNNAEQDSKSIEERVSGITESVAPSKAELNAKQDAIDRETARNLESLDSSSAMADERYNDDKERVANEARKEGTVKAVKGGIQTAVGGVRMYAGDTGGVKDVVNGLGTVSDGVKQVRSADTVGTNVALNNEQARSVSNSNYNMHSNSGGISDNSVHNDLSNNQGSNTSHSSNANSSNSINNSNLGNTNASHNTSNKHNSNKTVNDGIVSSNKLNVNGVSNTNSSVSGISNNNATSDNTIRNVSSNSNYNSQGEVNDVINAFASSSVGGDVRSVAVNSNTTTVKNVTGQTGTRKLPTKDSKPVNNGSFVSGQRVPRQVNQGQQRVPTQQVSRQQPRQQMQSQQQVSRQSMPRQQQVSRQSIPRQQMQSQQQVSRQQPRQQRAQQQVYTQVQQQVQQQVSRQQGAKTPRTQTVVRRSLAEKQDKN